MGQLQLVVSSLAALGVRRLVTLGLVGLIVFAAIGAAGYILSRPGEEVLYSGLDRQDVGRIGMALREANISFDVSSDGTTVLVRYGETARARMLLAEKGLPNGASAGYELFDKLGSLGLTSFMQEVTRLRAVEGELARTIQLIRGVKAARVHIVLAEEASFRRVRQQPSASVVLRLEGTSAAISTPAIRHLVAAAIPGMTPDQVTVVNSDGTLLTSSDEGESQGPNRMRGLEKTVSQEIQETISKTLAPYLGSNGYHVSVSARINTDKRQTNETIYNPDSRVERSVRVTKESLSTQNSTSQGAASVERNLPQDKAKNDGKQSSEENQKKEELTNYEVSSKNVTTVSAGYVLEALSVAVLVNRSKLASALGDKATPERIASELAEIEKIVSSSAGFRKERGDVLKVSVVDFSASKNELEPVAGPSIFELLLRQSGPVINGLSLVIVAFLLIWLGLRPVTRALMQPAANPTLSGIAPAMIETGLVEAGSFNPQQSLSALPSEANANLIEDISGQPRRVAQRRLEQLVEFDEQQAADVLKQWMREGSAA